MAILTIAVVDEDGVDPGFVAANGGGDEFANDGATLLLVNNQDASAKTVTITAQTTTDVDAQLGKLTKSNRIVNVPAGEIRVIGPLPSKAFNDVNGRAQVSYSAVTSVTVAAVRTS